MEFTFGKFLFHFSWHQAAWSRPSTRAGMMRWICSFCFVGVVFAPYMLIIKREWSPLILRTRLFGPTPQGFQIWFQKILALSHLYRQLYWKEGSQNVFVSYERVNWKVTIYQVISLLTVCDLIINLYYTKCIFQTTFSEWGFLENELSEKVYFLGYTSWDRRFLRKINKKWQ